MSGIVGPSLVAGTLLWIYADVARALVKQWFTSADASYGLILLAVAAVLAWRRRHLIGASADDGVISRLAGLVLLASGCALFIAGSVAADLFTTRASMVVVLAGLVWFLLGRRACRTLTVPFVLLLVAIPLPELVVNTITLPLQVVASRIAQTLLTAAHVPVTRDGNLLTLPSVTLQVAEACSGLRSAISLSAVAVLLAWRTRGSLGRRAIVMFVAAPIAVVTNGIRIAVTGLAAQAWGPSMAGGAWHEATGWMVFLISTIALVAIYRVIDRPAVHPLVQASMVHA